jgi:hypothetical protein
MWAIWLEGGSTYELIFDYGGSGAGDTATIQALAETLDSITSV